MTIFFNTQLSSNLIYHPIPYIDSIEDLAQFITKHPNVKLNSDKSTTSWPLVMNWEGQQGEVIKKRLTNVPSLDYDYSDVYNGRTMIIGPDVIFLHMMNINSHLKFHISRDRHYGSQLRLLYSKSIDRDLKYELDSICMSSFESGMLNSYKEIYTRFKRLNLIDFGDPNENPSIDFIVTRIRFFISCFILIIVLLLIEIILAAYIY